MALGLNPEIRYWNIMYNDVSEAFIKGKSID